jgi:hypothetical protein
MLLSLVKELPTTGGPEGHRALMQYLEQGLYPVCVPPEFIASLCWKGKLPSVTWLDIAESHHTHSFRELARKYGVSHEAIRHTLQVAESYNYSSSKCQC